MMQVKEVSSKGLKHEFSVKVPHAEVEASLTKRLEEVAQKANIKGFRPGKAPMTIIKQHYGASVRAEVLEDAISDGMRKTFEDRKLRPALQPKVDLVSAEEGKDLEFKIEVEVLPEIKLKDLSKLSFERPVVDVEEKKITETIERAAKQMRQPEIVTEKRGAKMGDVLVMDFDGSVDGERQPGMKAEKHQLELGSKSFIDNFEEQLVGLKAGDEKKVNVKFPDDYHAKNLAGKKAVFEVKVHEIRAHKPLVFDDALAVEVGFKTLDELKKRISDSIGDSYKKAGRSVLKKKLLDALAKEYDFPIPEGLVEAEFDGIWAQVEQSKKRGELPKDDQGKSDEALKKEYRGIAERRIRLGLLLAEISLQQKITVTPNEVQQAIMEEASRFPGQEQMVVNYFTKTEGALERLRAPILEEKAVDYILSQTKVTDKKMSFEDLQKMQEDEE